MHRWIGPRVRTKTEFVVSMLVLLLVAMLPLVVTNDYWRGVLIVSMYFAMLAAAWNLLAGYTGQFSLAPATFGMIGGYVTGLLSYYWHVWPLLGIAASILVAGLIGFVLGRIVLRLTGPYLALTTLSFAEIIRLVISNSIEITRGDLGLNVAGLLRDRLAYYYLMLGVLVWCSLVCFCCCARPPAFICAPSAMMRSPLSAAACASCGGRPMPSPSARRSAVWRERCTGISPNSYRPSWGCSARPASSSAWR